MTTQLLWQLPRGFALRAPSNNCSIYIYFFQSIWKNQRLLIDTTQTNTGHCSWGTCLLVLWTCSFGAAFFLCWTAITWAYTQWIYTPFCLQLPRSLRIARVVHVKTCSPRSLPAGQREHCVWAMLVPSTSQFPLSIWFTGKGTARRIIPVSQCWRCMSRLKFRLLMLVTLIKTGPTGGCGGTPWVWSGWC